MMPDGMVICESPLLRRRGAAAELRRMWTTQREYTDQGMDRPVWRTSAEDRYLTIDTNASTGSATGGSVKCDPFIRTRFHQPRHPLELLNHRSFIDASEL